MPPKFKYTKEEIVSAAMALVREGGMEALTARALGERLGTSAKPIFTQFQNMEELERAVLQEASKRYTEILTEEMTSGKYPPYKGSGMGYIRFAREEKEACTSDIAAASCSESLLQYLRTELSLE